MNERVDAQRCLHYNDSVTALCPLGFCVKLDLSWNTETGSENNGEVYSFTFICTCMTSQHYVCVSLHSQ